MEKITVIICEDHAFTRAGLQHWLEQDPRFDLCASVGTAVETLRQTRKLKPMIALLDYNLPDATGLEVLIELRRWVPDCKVVILTARRDGAIVQPLLNAGAHALLSKSSAPEEIGDALVEIAAGKQKIDKVFSDALEMMNSNIALSPRELEVLLRISKGMSNPDIARDLSLSAKTIETHRANLMRKMNVSSTATLMVKAAQAGLLDI